MLKFFPILAYLYSNLAYRGLNRQNQVIDAYLIKINDFKKAAITCKIHNKSILEGYLYDAIQYLIGVNPYKIAKR